MSKKVAFLFPGQGSQYIGMGKFLCDKYELARQTFIQAGEALGFNLQKLCWEGTSEELTQTENAQPALLTASVAAFRVCFQETGLRPEYSVGHSLGEITALTCAGAIQFSDAVKLVRQRGKLMQEAVALGSGAMAAVAGAEHAIIAEECRKISTPEAIVTISNYNSPQQTVISGHQDQVNQVAEVLKAKGAKVIPLKVSAPFHSPLMQPAADQFAVELQKYHFTPLQWPVLSNVTAMPYQDQTVIATNLTRQLVQPVRWVESMAYLRQQGIEVAIELGPQTVLKNLLKQNAPSIVAYSYDKEGDIIAIGQLTSGGRKEAQSSQSEFQHTVVTKCIQIAVCTRNRNWDNDAYQKGVVEPYRRIQALQDQLVKEGKEPSLEQMKAALEMLRSVFSTKQVPVTEQVERFNEVFEVTGTRGLFPDFEMPVS